jgi:hypothetical protein
MKKQIFLVVVALLSTASFAAQSSTQPSNLPNSVNVCGQPVVLTWTEHVKWRINTGAWGAEVVQKDSSFGVGYNTGKMKPDCANQYFIVTGTRDNPSPVEGTCKLDLQDVVNAQAKC